MATSLKKKPGKNVPSKKEAPAKAAPKKPAKHEPQNISREDLVKKVAADCDIAQANAKAIIESVFNVIGKELAAGNKVSIHGFGAFATSPTPEREGKNPQTGEDMIIPASVRVNFKASSSLKTIIKE